jgi:hypothetical protein
MKALIIGPSHSRSIAAVDLDTGHSLNLTLPREPQLGPGSIVEIHSTAPHSGEPPHREDLVADDARVTGETIADLAGWIGEHCAVHEGRLDEAFGGRLTLGNKGINYLAADQPAPDHSVEFWRIDKPMTIKRSNWLGRTRLHYRSSPPMPMVFKYIGQAEPVEVIPSGSIIRLVLSPWLENEKYGRSCWPRLSGWY